MLVQIWRSTGNFRGEAKVSTFIYQICINTALSFPREKSSVIKKDLNRLTAKYLFQPALDTEKDERLQKLYAVIRELKPIDRAIVSLYLDDKSYEENGGNSWYQQNQCCYAPDALEKKI